MCIIQLNRDLRRPFTPLPRVFLHEPSDYVLYCRANEKILLLQPQLLSCRGGIVRIEHTRDRFSLLSLFQSFKVVALVERVKVELLVRNRLPQSQVDSIESAVARNRIVKRSGHDRIPPFPDGNLLILVLLLPNFPVKPDDEVQVNPLYFPRIAMLQPVVWNFHLAAVVNDLSEDPVAVSDSITSSWVI